MVHDVLDLTFPAYRSRRKTFFDRLRLEAALRRADLTWYVSRHTLDATKRLVGHVGRRPRIRYSAVDDMFRTEPLGQEVEILAGYNLEPGYILCVGNGMPHKNVGLLLACENVLARPVVFVGVRPEMEAQWRNRFPQTRAIWLRNLPDRHLPCVMRNAFCLVQPSFIEGFGFPPLEAMACGTPALVSDIPVLRETTGGCAWVANPHRHDEWVFAIEKLETEALRRKMISLGLRYTRTFQGGRAWSKHIADLIALQGAR
jgi:glycosyltransferase involved in cell wall biosynthesis